MRECMAEVGNLARMPGKGERDDDRRYDEVHARHAREAIQRWMDREKLTQKAVAHMIGVNQGTVSRALREPGQPSVRLLISLSPHMAMTLGEILGVEKPGGSVAYPELGTLVTQIAELREEVHKLRASSSTKPPPSTTGVHEVKPRKRRAQ